MRGARINLSVEGEHVFGLYGIVMENGCHGDVDWVGASVSLGFNIDTVPFWGDTPLVEQCFKIHSYMEKNLPEQSYQMETNVEEGRR